MRVLFLTHRLPYAPNRGDRLRAFHMLRTVAPRVEMDVFSLVHDAEEASHARELEAHVASLTTAFVPKLRNHVRAAVLLAGSQPLTHALLDSPAARPSLQRIVRERRPDVVLAFCSGMARFALAPPLDRYPYVLDMVDVDSRKWDDLSRASSPPGRWIYAREARTLARFEAYAACRARSTLVVNDRERALLAALAPGARLRVVPNGIDLSYFRPPGPPAQEAGIVFCGVMNYAPNEAAALWLAREVWPLVRARHPGAHLTLVGSHPTGAIRRLAAGDPSIEVTGTVPDVRPYLWRSAVSAAPLLISRGVQNKVIEAIAAGLPVVITPAVSEGLPGEVMPACRVAGSAEAFAEALLRFLDAGPAERRAAAGAANLTALAWSDRLAPLTEILSDAARCGS